MKQQIAKGFTLVEILIVVVILGILAAIVVPQFTNASQDAIKGALASQLQTINSQIELYRVQNAGTLPDQHAVVAQRLLTAAAHNGWGTMVEDDFLKDEPNNGYTRSTNVTAGVTADPATDGSDPGWAYDAASGEVLANGYDDVNNLLGNEAGFANPAF